MKDFTIRDFDNIREDHIFSSRYQRNLRRVMNHQSPRTWNPKRTLVIVSACLVLIVGGIYAASAHGDFFHNAFGKGAGREDQPVREETYLMDKEDGNAHEAVHVYPSHEYEEPDEEKAESMVGENVAVIPGNTVTVRNHTFTLLSAIRDSHVLVMEYTIECPDGVNVLTWDDHSFEWHGAVLSPEACFQYSVDPAYSKIYVDETRSTDTMLYCTEYDFLFDENWQPSVYAAGESPKIRFVTYDPEPDLPILSLYQRDPEISEESLTIQYLDTGAVDPVEETEFITENGSGLTVSPLGMRIDLDQGKGPVIDDDGEPLGYDFSDMVVTITYKDGSEYTVYDFFQNIENVSSMMAAGQWGYISFNRLVDVDQISGIQVKDMVYKAG